jgi:hypothetical protein
MNRGHAALARRGQERVCVLTPKPVGLREAAVEIPREAHVGQSGRLVDDRVRLRFQHGFADGARVEQIEHDRVRPERAKALGVFGRPGGADHVVSCLDQLGNQPGTDCAARSGDEDFHGVSPLGHITGISGVCFV